MMVHSQDSGIQTNTSGGNKKFIVIKIRRKTVIVIVFVFLGVFLAYTVFLLIRLGTYSEKLETQYNENNIENKSIDEAVKILGKPNKVECVTSGIKGGVVNSYLRLTYYTDSPLLNFVGYFPGGGTRIIADSKGRITTFKTYLY